MIRKIDREFAAIGGAKNGEEILKRLSFGKVIKMDFSGLHRSGSGDILTERLGNGVPEALKSSLNIGENADCEILKENHK